MNGHLDDKARLQHILDAIAEIVSYTVQADFDDFTNHSMMRFASIKQPRNYWGSRKPSDR
jgi:uncharacterized protein with HEPN domain